ncbi:hypothetical protein D3C77_564810 [compost metagenome]
MALFGQVQPISHGLADRDQQATAEPLQQAPNQQAFNRISVTGERRAEGKHAQRKQQDPAFPPAAGQPRTQRDHHSEAEYVQVAGPTQLRDGGLQFVAQYRVGGIEGKEVE